MGAEKICSIDVSDYHDFIEDFKIGMAMADNFLISGYKKATRIVENSLYPRL